MTTVGSIFAIPLPDDVVGRRAIGQVIGRGAMYELLVVVFEGVYSEGGATPACDDHVLLCAPTGAVALIDGWWPLLGQSEVPSNLGLFPCYQSLRSGKRYVETFEGEIVAEIPMSAPCLLRNRFQVSVGTVTSAFLAYHGYMDWTPHLDRFLEPNWREYCLRSERVRSSLLSS